jgi:hypothetical protein
MITRPSQPNPVLRAFAEAYNVPSADAAMRVACTRLLDTCSLSMAPIALKPICDYLNIRVITKETPGTATLRATKDGFELWMSPTKSTWRRDRFTIAHEISHAILIMGLRDPDFINSLASDESTHNEVERLCDIGAAELLMPRTLIADALEQYGLAPNGLRRIYDRFFTSYRAILMRIAQVIPSSAMVLWKRYARGAHEQTLLRVWSCNPYYRIRMHSPWLPKGSTTRHIFPDVISDVANHRYSSFVPDIEVRLNRLQACMGVVGVIPSGRTSEAQLPLFEGMMVEDETEQNIDAFSLLAAKNMAEGSPIWETLKKHLE